MSIEKGCYLKASICVSRCGWTEASDRSSTRITPPRLVCPSCGGELEVVVGRYLYTDYSGWFGLVKWRQYVGFEEK